MKSIKIRNTVIVFGTTILTLFLAQLLLAQIYDDPSMVYEPATEGGFIPGARAAGMGGAQIAAGNDGSALWYNPALITRIRKTELSATLTHQRITNKTTFPFYSIPSAVVSNTRLGSLWAIYPLATVRGGLSLGLSINRVKSFDRIFRYASSPTWIDRPNVDGWGGGEDESGGLWAYSFGAAVEVSPKVSVGGSLDILDGTDNYGFFFNSLSLSGTHTFDETKEINDSYTGISGKIGATYSANNYLTLGAIVGLPQSINVDQTSSHFINETDSLPYSFRGAISYRYSLPFSFGAGAAFSFNGLIITGDFKYLDYSQLEYQSGIDSISLANMTARHYYKETFNLHAGAEYSIPGTTLKVRAGYYREPIPFKGNLVEIEPNYYTMGLGYIVDNNLNFDFALMNGSWKRNDVNLEYKEKYSPLRFMLTMSYRL